LQASIYLARRSDLLLVLLLQDVDLRGIEV
jgi:hypothetical protein